MPQPTFKANFIKYSFPVTIIIPVAILAVGIYFYLIPFYKQTIEAKSQEMEAIQKQNDDRLAELKELAKVKGNYASIALVEKEKLKLLLPVSSEIPELLIQLDTIAKSSGLTISSFSLSEVEAPVVAAAPPVTPVTPEGGSSSESQPSASSDASAAIATPAIPQASPYKTQQVTLGLSGGSYPKLKIFLERIEHNVRLLDINSINFENSFENIDITLNTYYYPEQ